MLPPSETARLVGCVTAELNALLETLSKEEWHRKSANGRWIVRDIAAHLLDGSLRRISAQRDGYVSLDARSEFSSYDGLLAYLNALNADWIRATRRLSPRVILSLLREADRELAAFIAVQDGGTAALWPVAWAGEAASRNWFDLAREYTEKWHHTQQLFEITGRNSTIVTRDLLFPVLDTFLYALPRALAETTASKSTIVQFSVRDPFDSDWYAENTTAGWRRVESPGGPVAARVTCSALTAWKLCTSRTSESEAARLYPDLELTGNRALAASIVQMVSVMI